MDEGLQKWNIFFWALVQLIILILCISYINYIYVYNILPDKEVKETYEQTQCSLVKKQLTTKGHLIYSYRADFLLAYVIRGTNYSSWATGNGLDNAFSTNKETQETALSQFALGGTYPCWYNPREPQIVVLILRHNWSSTFPLLIPSIILVIMIFYLSRTLIQLLITFSKKTKK